MFLKNTFTTPIFLKLYSFAQLAYCTQYTEPLSISTLWGVLSLKRKVGKNSSGEKNLNI